MSMKINNHTADASKDLGMKVNEFQTKSSRTVNINNLILMPSVATS